jgi:prepilin-type processing-associated H-X9-DG protein
MTRASDLAKLLGAGATILDGTTISTADNTTQLTLTSTDADASVGPVLDLRRDSSSPADGDAIGRIRYRFDNDNGDEETAIFLDGTLADASDGTEDASFKVQTKVAGTARNRIDITSSEVVLNEDSIDSDFRVESNGNANMLFVDGGNDIVGIGTNSPSFENGRGLEINYSGGLGSHLKLTDSASGSGGTNGFDLYAFNTSGYIENYEAGSIVFRNNGAERMRIDASGNLLVGNTSTIPFTFSSGTGAGITSTGTLMAGATAEAGLFNRVGGDGNIVNFYRAGTIVGNIGTATTTLGTNPYIAGSGGRGLSFDVDTNAIFPCTSAGARADDSANLGVSSARFNDIFATNGTIQTSDRNEKQDIEELSDAEQRVAVVAKGLMRKFRWKDSVAEKGDNARTHFGIIAQDLQDAFTAEGLDAGDYAMFCSNTWTDDDGNEQTRLGVRYNQLLAFIISAI